MELWNDFIERSGPRPPPLRLEPLSIPTDRCAVVVEPRRHPHMDYVLRNVMHFLGPGWRLRIYHGTANEDYVRRIVGDQPAVLTSLEVDNLSIPAYNQRLCSPAFWSGIPEENILVFEMDVLLLRRGIDAFMGYDYIGAPWSNGRVGNSGLSLRRRTAMLRTCQQSPPNQTLGNDIWFCHYLPRCGYRIAPLELARDFASEQLESERPFGVHAPFKYLPEGVVARYLRSIRYEEG